MPTAFPNFDFCRQLALALGMADRPITKIVIEADVNSAVCVYVKEYLSDKNAAKVIDAVRLIRVADARVNDRGEVEVDKPEVIG